MPHFVDDNTNVPDGKVDAAPRIGAAENSVTAAEWNTAMQALKDLRDRVVTTGSQAILGQKDFTSGITTTQLEVQNNAINALVGIRSGGLGDAGGDGVSSFDDIGGRVTQFCHKVAVGESVFDANGGVSGTIVLWDFTASSAPLIKIDRVVAIVDTPFAGSPSDLTCEVGIAGDTDCFLESFSCYSAPSKGLTLADSGAAIAAGDFGLTAPFELVAKFDCSGSTLGSLNQGQVIFYIEGKYYP